ncbi:hypothetical protein MASR2M48_22470 [Spirochaetota bacterium]
MAEPTLKTILLVEDEAKTALSEKVALEKCAYVVKTVPTGEKAVALLNEYPDIDLVLIDIDLGDGLDGVEAAESILQDHDIPILFLFSKLNQERIEKTLDLASYGYVADDTPIVVLDASIKTALNLFDRRKQLQRSNELLRATEDRFELAMNNLDGSLWTLDKDLVFTASRGQGLVALGLEPDQIVGMKLTDFLKTDDPLDVALNAHRRALLGEKVNYESTNSGLTFRSSLTPLKDAQGTIKGVAGIATNITQSRVAEDSLRSANELLHAVLNTIPQAICWKDRTSLILGYNTAYAKLLEVSDDASIVGIQGWSSAVAQKEIEASLAIGRRIMEEDVPEYHRIETLVDIDGEVRVLDTSRVPLHDNEGVVTGLLVSIDDVTERKHNEDRLSESEETYRSILNASPDDIIITDLKGHVLLVSPATLKTMSCVEEDLIGRSLLDFIVPEDRDRASGNIALMFQGVMSGIGEYRLLRLDGKVIDVEVNAEFIRDVHGLPLKIVFIVRDITDKRRVETRYKMLFDMLPVGMAMINHQTGAFLDANKSLLKSTGYTREEFLGMTFWDITPEEYQEQEKDQVDELNETDVFKTKEKEYIKKDGSRYPIALSGAKIIDYDGAEVVWGIIEDITERKQAEERIRSLLAEKELVLKEVHHRIKNNMNTISSLLSLQAQALDEPSALAAFEDASARVQSMGLLYDKLYRSSQFTELSIKEYLSSLVDDVVANFPNGNRVSTKIEIDDFILDVKRLQALGIIINELLTNIMKYAFKEKEYGHISVSALRADRRVTLTVQDDGSGIPESVSFESPKGFGLQLVHALTQQLHGVIRIERGTGTRIVLEFDT